MAAQSAPVGYLLHLADNALVLGQRNAEWCANGPVLEEDIAMANISLDLIGQARLLYQHAAAVLGDGVTEDRLAYFRGPEAFRNFALLELPHHGPSQQAAAEGRDYATTIVRNFLYSAFALLRWDALEASADPQLAAIAGRSVKEVRYHLRHARDWLVRMGDGTAESHARAQAALDHLLPYTAEFWSVGADEAAGIADGSAVDTGLLRAAWEQAVGDALAEATLQRPDVGAPILARPQGRPTKHLRELLAEMQSLARAHPEALW